MPNGITDEFTAAESVRVRILSSRAPKLSQCQLHFGILARRRQRTALFFAFAVLRYVYASRNLMPDAMLLLYMPSGHFDEPPTTLLRGRR